MGRQVLDASGPEEADGSRALSIRFAFLLRPLSTCHHSCQFQHLYSMAVVSSDYYQQ